MNIKEYILSGIVESYVLGLASEEERTEFERLCIQYPELVEARKEFEIALEKQAMGNAVKPPVDCKEKIWSAIQQQTPASNTSKIITMEPTTKRSSGVRWVAAASVILMLAAGYFAYDFYSKNKDLKDSNDQIQAQLKLADSILRSKAEEEKIVHDPNVTVVDMEPMTPSAPSASVCWDTTSSDVYLILKNMPRLASDKQYQLWSLIDSAGSKKPTSLGAFDGGKEKLFIKMKNAQKADNFAITIEDKGNEGGPNLKQLQIMGDTKKRKL